ncbi:SRPBCC family protein [Streptomyces sp. NPDC059740]|uniref:SRPBCC family protein n=1 Tax=Streptomyces sp. NPDC059740 TaxID=3346926 RepID=UPI003652DFFE
MRARRLEPVSAEFVDTAPLRLVFGGRVAASPRAVYSALVEEAESYGDWFLGVRRVLTVPAAGVSGPATRHVWLAGGVRCAETVLAADPGQRYLYRVDEMTAPGVRALLEEWRLAPAGAGTRVRWTVAVDAGPATRLALHLARPAASSLFRRSLRTLQTRLRGDWGP